VERGKRPRKALDSALLEFIAQVESQSQFPDLLLESIAKSSELRALIARIAAEL
jgi:hypothetical protein